MCHTGRSSLESCSKRLTNCLIRRPATTDSTKVSTDSAYSILEAQRRQRPTSPHLSIYRPQITWYLSIFNRITGSVLSGGMYTFGFLYLISPLFGWQLGSAALAASFGALPVVVALALKSFVGFFFSFHSFNGIRHLIWDLGYAFKNQEVIQTGWTVIGLSVLSTIALLFA